MGVEPKYDILLRQDIGATDMYLNLGDRDPGSDHCDQLVVKVQMPDTELKNITLEVLEDRLLVQSPKYRLNLALPHRVKKDDGPPGPDAALLLIPLIFAFSSFLFSA